MSTGGTIALVIGVLAVFYLAINRGLINSGVQVGVGPGGVTSTKGIVAPQPSQNYGGYLAASTAPGVSSALNGALTGLGSAFAGWFGPTNPIASPAQGASPNSPSGAAQPSGPSVAAGAAVAAATPGGGSYAEDGWIIGPQVDPAVSYNSTAGSAFDYSGLASDNGYDPSVALSI